MKITKIETNYKRNLFFKETQNIKFQNYTNSVEKQVIQIYPSIHYQTFLGFGGAFTEATSYAINQLPNKIANNLFKEYFSKECLQYTLCRLTIGSSDFSIKPDYAYIIPAIHYAQKINPNLQFLASLWSTPKFMKTNQSLYSGGKLLIHTEGCTGYSKFKSKDEVNNAEIYGHDILGDLNAGINGYIDWNMVLDYKGGPNHQKNYCNAPIMLNRANDNYIKNLTFYYIGHFSKFIQPFAKRIVFSRYSTDIEVTAFKNPDNTIAIVMLNRTNLNKEYNLIIDNIVIHDNLDNHAIVSYTIK